MKQLALFTFLLFLGGALQAQHADCRIERLANNGTSTFIECENQTGARYSVEIQTLKNEPVFEFTTSNLPQSVGDILLPKGIYNVRIIQDGVLVSEEIRIQE